MCRLPHQCPLEAGAASMQYWSHTRSGGLYMKGNNHECSQL
nr:MAG TPA: hypothetical protein [Caudoviricetes sp.]DAU70406.1 MAG TPA: hypothetical protein [Caudoviricetes sp.]